MTNKWGNDEYSALSFVLFVVFVFAIIGILIYLVVSHFFGPLVGIVITIVSIVGWLMYRVKREWIIK